MVKNTFVERPTTFRVNNIKFKHQNIKTELESKGFKIRQIPWYKDAFVLLNKSKKELMELDIYIEGKIYIQSLASMVPPLILDPKPGEKILDLTAAPGSKTSQIAALMNLEGELVANEINKIRFFKLKHNMELLGVDQGADEFLKLKMEDGSKLCREYPEYFDKILLDAPCSAETRFIEGNPKTYGYWNERKIKDLVYTQWKLLLSAWSSLKPGGGMVYSTCTFAPEENEIQISKFMERVGNAVVHKIDLPLKKLPVLKKWKDKEISKDLQKALRIMPDKEIEGFFVVKIVKLLI